MGLIVNYKSHTFAGEYEHVLSHIRATNPHPEGSRRDALTHGVYPHKYCWTKEAVRVSLDQFQDVECVGHVLDYRAMIRCGSLPPAIVLEMLPSGLLIILDGAHRVVSCQLEKIAELDAYIGIPRYFAARLVAG